MWQLIKKDMKSSLPSEICINERPARLASAVICQLPCIPASWRSKPLLGWLTRYRSYNILSYNIWIIIGNDESQLANAVPVLFPTTITEASKWKLHDETKMSKLTILVFKYPCTVQKLATLPILHKVVTTDLEIEDCVPQTRKQKAMETVCNGTQMLDLQTKKSKHWLYNTKRNMQILQE